MTTASSGLGNYHARALIERDGRDSDLECDRKRGALDVSSPPISLLSVDSSRPSAVIARLNRYRNRAEPFVRPFPARSRGDPFELHHLSPFNVPALARNPSDKRYFAHDFGTPIRDSHRGIRKCSWSELDSAHAVVGEIEATAGC